MRNWHFISVVSVLAIFSYGASAQETRAQVKAEAQQAEKAGAIPFGDLDRKPDQVNPKRYPSQAASASGLTRAQVKAETVSAERAGDVQVGESGRTLAEEDPARYAGAPASAPKLHLKHRVKANAAAASSAN